MNIQKRTRITLVLASCLLAVPSANAMVQSDGQTYAFPSVGDDHARVANVTPVATSALFTPGDDHARTATATPRISPPVTTGGGGFDWDDAGIGFGTAAGLALLAGGTLLTSRKMRASRTPAV